MNKSITINPKNYVWSYIFRAETKKLLNNDSYKNDLNKALDICNKAIQINKSPENYLTRAIVYAYLEQYDKAIADCDNEHNKYKNDYITYDIKTIIYSYLFKNEDDNYEKTKVLREKAKKQNDLLLTEINLIGKIDNLENITNNAKKWFNLLELTEEQVKLDGEITDNERKDAINCIAKLYFYQYLLKDQPDYTEKMKKHNENIAFLKKELNITEQEIQNEIKKLQNE